MYTYHTDMAHIEHTRNAIHDEVKHIHLGNRIHRAKKASPNKTAVSWLHVLSRLHRIRIQISFDLEDPSPEPKGASG